MQMKSQQLSTKDKEHQQNHRSSKRIKNYIYNPHDLVGSGFSSQVFKGINENNLEPIAIKVIQLSKIKNQVEKYLLNNQIAALRAINHRNVLRNIDILTTKKNVYIVTQYCSDGDLLNYIKKAKKNKSQKSHTVLMESQALNIIKDVLEGYQVLQEKGILHRDLKSANIFLEKGSAKIADFGFCQIISETKKPQISYNVGSPAYMSPQSYKQNLYSHKSDLWSIGIILYEMLIGETPDKTSTYDIMVNNLLSGRINCGGNQHIKSILCRCFQRDLRDRFDSRGMLEAVNMEIHRLKTRNSMITPQVGSKNYGPFTPNATRFSQVVTTSNHIFIPSKTTSPIIQKQQNQRSKTQTGFKDTFFKNSSNNQHKNYKDQNQKSNNKQQNHKYNKDYYEKYHDSSQSKTNEGQQLKKISLKPSVQVLLFLYRLLKFVSDTSLQQAQLTRLILFRHRSLIDQTLPAIQTNNQIYQQFQYLKSRFDQIYIQKQLTHSSNNPTIILLNKLTNSQFTDFQTLASYKIIFKQACKACQNYIFGVGTVEESVIDFNKIGIMWDYLMMEYQILTLLSQNKSILQISQIMKLQKIVKQKPKKLMHEHYQLLKYKNQHLDYHRNQQVKITEFKIDQSKKNIDYRANIKININNISREQKNSDITNLRKTHY